MNDNSRSETVDADLVRLRRLSSLAPNDPDLRLKLADRLLNTSFLDDAIYEIRAVIAMAPNHLEARKLLEKAIAQQVAKSSCSSHD
jgi:hypothetical protein